MKYYEGTLLENITYVFQKQNVYFHNGEPTLLVHCLY